MRNVLFTIISICFFICPNRMEAQVSMPWCDTGGDATIIGLYQTTSESESYMTFHVEVPSDGDYYMSFWLLPAKYANGEYSSYRVLVNDTEVGNVVTSKGNWQNAGLVGNNSVSLQKGENTISIAVSLPEIAEVQSVRLSRQKADVVMDSQMYDNYLRKAQNADDSNVQHTDITGYLPTSDINSSSVFPLHEKNIPLKYSVYKGFMFTKDQEVVITTTSKHKHIIDFFIANGHGVKQEFMSWLAVSEIPNGYSPSDSFI
ncbi:MAG: hypothetical protein IJ467_05310 [Bacteroidaceae bacterium]|nr:hypothetical protein [Bacteroidaceae bacterium]